MSTTPGERERAVDSAQKFAESSSEITSTRTITWQDPVSSAAVGAEMAGLDYVRAIQAGEVPPPPIAVVMNYSIAELDEGLAIFEGQPGEEHYNPIGVVHGGYAATILDSALGCAVHTTLPAGAGYTSQTLEVKYIRPITRETGMVRCEADVVHRGRQTATSEARLTVAESGKLLATGTSTCLILGG
ncbi:MAG: PaaI family thioesterase [Solirubrobacterales bacterium]